MANLPLALSVHHFSLLGGRRRRFCRDHRPGDPRAALFRAGSRDRHLREQAYEAAQRVAQLEARLTSLARQQAAAAQVAPARAVQAGGVRAPAPAPAFAGAVAMAPGPPAGVAAPALAAATRLIPATPVAEPQPTYDEHGVAEPAAQPVDDTALGSLPPATAAAVGGNGSSKGAVASPPRVTPATARSAGDRGRRTSRAGSSPAGCGVRGGRSRSGGAAAAVLRAAAQAAISVCGSRS